MKQTRLGNICMDILAHWYGKRRVDEEQAHIFFNGILDQMDDQGKEPSKEYQELAGKLHEMWYYRDFERMSAEEIFLCGGLWGGIKILELSVRRRDYSSRFQSYIIHKIIEKMSIFIHCIRKNNFINTLNKKLT